MPRILLIEDNPGDARLIMELLKDADNLRRSHKITHVERVSEAVKLLDNTHKFDLILSDITLPDSEGMATLDAMTAAAADVPVLFMTGTNDEALALAAIKHGAQDYLIKGKHDGESLSLTIQYAIERKRSQDAIAEAKAEARENAERIALLRDQKRQLLELTRAKDEFISLASHQLRTPATAVKQYLGMLVEGHMGDINEDIYSLIFTAYTSNERQLTVINDLLKTAQMDADNYQLKLQPENVTDLTAHVIGNLQPSLHLRGQTVDFDDTKPHMATVDADEFCLVVENIIENASKYTPPGETITVVIKSSKHYVTIAISDTGVGISPKDQKRIFEKFTRVDNELSDTVAGSGLGLYWVKRIMRMHGGSVTVQSEIDHGSTFTLRLPL